MAAEQGAPPECSCCDPVALGVLLVAAALALQTQLYTGQARTVTAIFMYVALALSWNLIGGYTGYASFGQVVFGIGGYLLPWR